MRALFVKYVACFPADINASHFTLNASHLSLSYQVKANVTCGAACFPADRIYYTRFASM